MTGLDPTAESHPDQAGRNPTGSLGSSEPVFLVVGKLRRPHGLGGEILMEIWTDFPERLRPGLQLYIGEEYLPCQLLKFRRHQDMLLVTLDGYPTREAVSALRNQYVYVRTAEVPPLPEGEFYHHQLLGLTVKDDTGKRLGEVIEIIETGANDVFVVRTPIGPDILIPYLDTLLIKVDLDRGELHTKLPLGLLGDDIEA
jgi:16S rRNA processing protein RimM